MVRPARGSPLRLFAVSFTTIITYEVIKLWKALGKGALEAFFGIKAVG